MTIKEQGILIDNEQLKKQVQELKNKIEILRNENNSFLYTALVKAQQEMPIIQKNSKMYGNQYYAPLDEIIKVSRPILTKNNLSVIQTFQAHDDNNYLVTTLAHSSGQVIQSKILLPKVIDNGKINPLQQMGKNITYLRRYTYSAIVGIATSEDL